MKKNLGFWIIFLFYLLVLLGFTIFEVYISHDYFWDSLVLISLLVVFFRFREKSNLSLFNFFLIGLFLLLHNCGVFGFYDMVFFGLEFDYYVHTFNGFVLSLVLYRLISKSYPQLTGKTKIFVILTFVLAVSSAHEILEYFGGKYLGEGMGFLKAGTSDIEMWDTQIDMRNNLLGSIIALVFYRIKNLFFSKR